MSAKTELVAARDAMLLVLDAKLAEMPEWKAFRAIDRGLAALRAEAGPPKSLTLASPVKGFPTNLRFRVMPSYAEMAVAALNEANRPLTSIEIIAEISKTRDLGPDAEKAKVNVTSSLSKDERIRSIPWSGAKAWWLADRDPPTNPAVAIEAGSDALFE